MRISLLFFCLALVIESFSQPIAYPQNYFRNPLAIPLDLSANFGELRNNHWHMGLDIRTKQKENQPVYAAAEGFITRIVVQPFGFGRAIYIEHPNGYTTLYAHLNDFSPALEEYTTQQQYKLESWQVDIELTADLFPVEKGQFIAYSGNTGGSQGPHLHFEIRDTETGKCLRPLLFGLPLHDGVSPSMLRLAMYDREISVYEQSPQLFTLKKTDTGYIIPKPKIIVTGSRKVSFAIQAHDKFSRSNNPNGIYTGSLFFDGEPVVEFIIDSIDYNETRFMNAHVDYRYRKKGGTWFQHLSQLPGEASGVYKTISGDGVINLNDTQIHTLRIEIEDAFQNSSLLEVKIQHSDALMKPSGISAGDAVLNPGEINVFEREDFEFFTEEQSVYDTTSIFYSNKKNPVAGAISEMHTIGDPSVPLHEGLTVRIKPTVAVSEEKKKKLVIRRNTGGRGNVRKGEWQNGFIAAKFDEFGSFQAFVDQAPPALNSPGKGDTINLSAATRLIFRPTDASGIKSFRAELNDEWLRFTNDKGSSYIYKFDERVPYGTHKLVVTVEDIVGNARTHTWWFKRGPYTPPKKKVVRKRTTPTKKKKG